MNSFYRLPFGSPSMFRYIVLIQPREHHRQDILDALYDTFCEVAKESPQQA